MKKQHSLKPQLTKKTYHTPKLKKAGTLQELTHGVGSSNFDDCGIGDQGSACG